VIDEQLEFQIAQYADGTLPAADAVALERVLASDAEARALLDEYRRLDATLKREMPLPTINWNMLASRLSDAVAEEDRATTTIAWPLRSWGKVAMAASIAIVIGLMAWWQLKPATPTSEIALNNGTTTSSSTGVNPDTAVAIVQITGPAAQAASQPAVAQIEIGPSPWAKQTNFGVADQVVYRRPRVLIASGQLDRQDTGRLPF
jgi:anti-sigma factor RsiW